MLRKLLVSYMEFTFSFTLENILVVTEKSKTPIKSVYFNIKEYTIFYIVHRGRQSIKLLKELKK